MLFVILMVTMMVGTALYALGVEVYNRRLNQDPECICLVEGSNPYCPTCYKHELDMIVGLSEAQDQVEVEQVMLSYLGKEA